MFRRKKKFEIIHDEETPLTSLREDAIMASMICLDEAYMIAKKRKDVKMMVKIADKWYGLSQEFEEATETSKTPFGFSIEADNDE